MNNIREFTKKIEEKEWTGALDKAFLAKKKEIKVDGFRKGCVPKDIYLKKVGIETLYPDAVDIILKSEYPKVIKENDLKPVCEPIIDVADISENHITFTFKIIEKPEVKLGDYKNLKVEKTKPKVTKAEVDAEIKKLQEQYADVVTVEDGKVELGNTVVIDFKGIVDGQVLEGGSGENYPLEIGSNTFIPGFETGLIGMKKDEEKVLNLKFPDEYVDNLKGKDVEFTVKVNEIKKRILPELNQEFYQDLGHEGVTTQEEFVEHLKKHLEEGKEQEAENKYVDELLKTAIGNMSVEINQEIIEDEVNRILEQYREQLKMQNLSLEQYLEFTKSNMESLMKMMEPEAINRIKARYLLEAIIEKEKIEVSEQMVESEIKKMAEMYQVSEDDIINMIGNKDFIKYDLKMRQAIEVIKNN